LIEEANKQNSTILLLGRIGTTYYCALELSYPFRSNDFEQYTELRPILPLLSPQDAALVGHVLVLAFSSSVIQFLVTIFNIS
jgi:hypothetical protein